MTCEQAAQRIIDDLTGNLAPAEVRQLQEHLATCDACRAEASGLEQTWADLGRLAAPAAGPSGVARLADRLAPSHRGAGRAPGGRPRRAGPMIGALAASVVMGLLVGYQIGQAGGEGAVVAPQGSEFLLLLREPAGGLQVSGVSEDELVGEYSAWGRALRDDGAWLDAARLEASPGRWVAGPQGRPVVPELAGAPFITGYFLVQMSDGDAALAAARQSPHLKYGGTIEIREIR